MAEGQGRFVAGGIAAGVPAMLAAWSGLSAREAEHAVPQDGRLVPVSTATLHVLEIGAGPEIVLIHGLGGQLRNFTYALTGRLPGRQLILIDRPGSGYSTGRAGPMRIEEQAGAIAELLGALGCRRPLVVGHSLGGAVALALALAHPERVGGLALVAPVTQAQESVPSALELWARLPRLARMPLAWTVGAPATRLAGESTLRQVFAPEPVPDDFAVRGGALLAGRPANVDAAAYEAGTLNQSLGSLCSRYAELSVPVGILFGRGDRMLDPEANGTRTAAQIAGAALEMVDGGHMLPVTQPERTARFVQQVGDRLGAR